ncbi:cellulose biosynthesis protein BcsG [Candidatus Methylospira mobilis]|uniref:Cellulose biosynthesis protein BcsG n=1 Tax=Candidatus Methylospira mobilis TaxID=1808979 RepID=A0A5Q0BK34_9GAMM|nr:cellulose biosynthesis protein BcsG [Candidatus Methylospira mobilis]QFY42166.1 cellulose biosynthesis protein BcsG [Candidatus Methylospira mobilis]WNV03180.1 cellulose biosynthesis protein BcsG [Candidatus Methylospira mobilis]
MGLWNYYFIGKLALYWSGYIGLHVAENLIFAAILIVPLPARRQRIARHLIAIPAAVMLLYRDSWFPSFERVIALTPNLQSFSFAYVVELLNRFINPRIIIGMLLLFALTALLGRRLRISSFVLLALACAPQITALVATRPSPETIQTAACDSGSGQSALSEEPPDKHYSEKELDERLNRFYTDQAKLHVGFGKIDASSKAFDIIFLHICSLAWDDIDSSEKIELFKNFDVLFTRFGSAASYSGPAAIRLLRGACGQQPHAALYQNAPRQCYLFDSLAEAGYTPQLLLNHDGHFGGFLQDVQERGGLKAPPLGSLGASVQMHSFDETPIYQDFDLLNRWLEKRKTQPEAPVALYYNTISLHDGNVLAGGKPGDSLDTYKPRMHKLMQDIDKFIGALEQSGRPSVVVLVAEHGAAIHGDSMQIAGMREIPSPKISMVPAAVKLIGLPAKESKAQVSDDNGNSYLALATLLADFMHNNPFAGVQPDLQHEVTQLPLTDFVSENEQTVVMGIGARYFMRAPNTPWNEMKSGIR